MTKQYETALDSTDTVMEKQQFMTPTEAMKILRLGREKFYRMLKDGEIPGAIRFGKQWRIDTDAFWAAIKKQSDGGLNQCTE